MIGDDFQVYRGRRKNTSFSCWDYRKWGKEIGEEFRGILLRLEPQLRLLATPRNTFYAEATLIVAAVDPASLISLLIR